jgi:hypothetical protein
MAFFNFRTNPQKGRPRPNNHHAVVTSGFNDNELHTVQLHYTERVQPDLGGARNFSYDLLALPLQDITGPFVAAASQFRLTMMPTAYFQQAPLTGMGGTFTGSFAFQPLLDPNNPAGIDVNDI